MLELYHNGMSSCSQKVRYVLAAKGLHWESVELNLRNGDQHQPGYLKLNPNGVVPTLIHDQEVFIEPGVICEYLQDLQPKPSLRPTDPVKIARMRIWIKYIDEYIHQEASVVSSAVAFRFTLLAKGEDSARAKVMAIPNEKKRERMLSVIFEGIESPLFAKSIDIFRGMIQRMDGALAKEGDFLTGDALSIADIVCLPYIVRLNHLQLAVLWSERPRIDAWLSKMQATAPFKTAIEDWLDPPVVELMHARGAEYWPLVARQLQ